MRRRWYAATGVALGFFAAAQPAQACRTAHPLNLSYVERADVVVVGRVENYRIVRDQKVRQKRKEQLARSLNMPAALRKSMESQRVFLDDYARFDLVVDEVLLGKGAKRLSVVWRNWTSREPKSLLPGPYLVALISTPDDEPGSLRVLQGNCSPPFIIQSQSENAAAIRRMIGRRRK